MISIFSVIGHALYTSVVLYRGLEDINLKIEVVWWRKKVIKGVTLMYFSHTLVNLNNTHQGAVTTMCPGLPELCWTSSATAIKMFDRQNRFLILWFVALNFLDHFICLFYRLDPLTLDSKRTRIYERTWMGMPLFRLHVVYGIKMSVKSPSQVEVQHIWQWLPLAQWS